MPWLELQLTVDASAQPRAEAALEALGALSVTLMDADADAPDTASIFAPSAGETPLWKSVALLALFAADIPRDLLTIGLQAALPSLAPGQILFREVADQAWERAWMDHYQPLQFGQRLWIYPWNIDPPTSASDTAIVRLDPGLAFGTGTHATTALCLTWLAGHALAGKTVLDYGCGSGVLALAALKLGAAHAIGVDIDPQALTASRANAIRNSVSAQLDLYAPAQLPAATQADVLLANILSGPLAALAPHFAALCKPGAFIVLSGILAGQQDALLQRYAHCGFDMLTTAQREDWVRIRARRQPAT